MKWFGYVWLGMLAVGWPLLIIGIIVDEMRHRRYRKK